MPQHNTMLYASPGTAPPMSLPMPPAGQPPKSGPQRLSAIHGNHTPYPRPNTFSGSASFGNLSPPFAMGQVHQRPLSGQSQTGASQGAASQEGSSREYSRREAHLRSLFSESKTQMKSYHDKVDKLTQDVNASVKTIREERGYIQDVLASYERRGLMAEDRFNERMDRLVTTMGDIQKEQKLVRKMQEKLLAVLGGPASSNASFPNFGRRDQQQEAVPVRDSETPDPGFQRLAGLNLPSMHPSQPAAEHGHTRDPRTVAIRVPESPTAPVPSGPPLAPARPPSEDSAATIGSLFVPEESSSEYVPPRRKRRPASRASARPKSRRRTAAGRKKTASPSQIKRPKTASSASAMQSMAVATNTGGAQEPRKAQDAPPRQDLLKEAVFRERLTRSQAAKKRENSDLRGELPEELQGGPSELVREWVGKTQIDVDRRLKTPRTRRWPG